MPHLRTTWEARAFITERGKKIMSALANPSLDTEQERKLVSELNTIIRNLAQRGAQPHVAKSDEGFGRIMQKALKGEK